MVKINRYKYIILKIDREQEEIERVLQNTFIQLYGLVSYLRSRMKIIKLNKDNEVFVIVRIASNLFFEFYFVLINILYEIDEIKYIGYTDTVKRAKDIINTWKNYLT